MQSKFRTACLVAAMMFGSTAIASAQNSTDRNGNAMGSEHVGNGTGATTGGAMQPQTGTVGSDTMRSQRDAPNGSPGAPPKAHAGPQGDPSKTEDGKR